jgi:hypothetical protein
MFSVLVEEAEEVGEEEKGEGGAGRGEGVEVGGSTFNVLLIDVLT